ncbi:MAG TPA: endonuclease/exonuclease/phosphatase family protein [Acidimicrobiales bacterium]|nr:endonuclease/exonuclease/phosphatase family protein [Acidimicrobiales bacterium]
MPGLSVANFNTHAGMDGWAHHYDLRAAVEQLDADVVVLQEIFAPIEGASQADELAEALGYTSAELPLARAWRRKHPLVRGRGWKPGHFSPDKLAAMRVGGKIDRFRDNEGYEQGTWGLAILSRIPILSTEAYEFGKLKRDFTHRGALRAELDLETGRPGQHFLLIGTHAAHVSAGSHVHFRHLRDKLPSPEQPSAAVGDMNIWGPPLTVLLPGWSRAVKGRTWPSWRPHSQIDHILVSKAVTIEEGAVLRVGNSDHLAIRAVLSW